MNRLYLFLVLLTTSAGIASSPTCRQWIEVRVHHSAATVARWTAWNKTPAGQKWVAAHPHGYRTKETLAALEECRELLPETPQLTGLIPVEPGIDVPDFALVAADDSPVPLVPASPGLVETAEATPPMGTPLPIWTGPIFPGGGSGGGVATVTAAPVADVPEPGTWTMVAAGLVFVARKAVRR